MRPIRVAFATASKPDTWARGGFTFSFDDKTNSVLLVLTDSDDRPRLTIKMGEIGWKDFKAEVGKGIFSTIGSTLVEGFMKGLKK